MIDRIPRGSWNGSSLRFGHVTVLPRRQAISIGPLPPPGTNEKRAPAARATLRVERLANSRALWNGTCCLSTTPPCSILVGYDPVLRRRAASNMPMPATINTYEVGSGTNAATSSALSVWS